LIAVPFGLTALHVSLVPQLLQHRAQRRGDGLKRRAWRLLCMLETQACFHQTLQIITN
jgi:hypothetical protein